MPLFTKSRASVLNLTALITLALATNAGAQTRIGSSATVDEYESLLIGAIDTSSISLGNGERSLYLKGNVQYSPLPSQVVRLESIRGYPDKMFFFVKLAPRQETTKGLYTLAVETTPRRFRNVVTFPVDARRCEKNRAGELICGGGLTDLGSIVVDGSFRESRDGGGVEYEFKRVKDENVQTAFSRRFKLEIIPRIQDGKQNGTILSIVRR